MTIPGVAVSLVAQSYGMINYGFSTLVVLMAGMDFSRRNAWLGAKMGSIFTSLSLIL